MIAADTDLDALCKRLHLANARRAWRGLIDRAERERWSYHDFLTLLVTEEIAHRQQTRLARLTRRAHFPFLKTIDDFNFTYQSSLRLQMLGSALAPDFVSEGRSLILAGKPGRGKTHLAVAIAYRAIQNGFDAVFTTAAALIDDLSAAFRAGELTQALPTYTHPAVLIVDEVGYLTYGTDAANMLFHVVNERHRRQRSMIFTTNKSLKAWGRVLHDDDLAQAIIDRVLERGRVLRLDGPSVRTLHVNLDEAMKEESDQDADLVRISGKSRSEFPEPTNLSDPNNCGGIGSSVTLKGLFLVNDVESSYAICGTALSIEGAFVLENSFIHDNGWDTNMSWADGITVQGCTPFGPYTGEVRDNIVQNSTDVGLVTGGGPCQVYSNQISQTNIHAFAGLMVGWFPGGGGNHAGANYYSNTITSSFNGMAFGLMVGFEPWWAEAHGYDAYVPNAGNVTGNSVSGAMINLAIDGIGTGSILNNTIGSVQGTRAFFCTTTPKLYTAHLFGTAIIQGGWEPFWFFASRCDSWNPSLPQPDHPGSLAHGRRLLPFTEINSSPAGNYTLAYQNDGNLVLYNSSTHEAVWWQPGPVGSPSAAIMQEDANFVVYSAVVWSTNTSNWNDQGAYLVVQDDGNLVVYKLNGEVLWHRFQ